MNEYLTEDQARMIFDAHASFIHRTVYLLTKSNAIADDITQETFIRAFQKFNTFNESKPLRPWLYKIAINLTRNHARKHTPFVLTGDIPEPSVEGIETQILQQEENRILRDEIDKLPKKMRQIVILHYFAELRLPEVAEALGIPLGTCKSRLNSALSSLRKSMAKQATDFSSNGGN